MRIIAGEFRGRKLLAPQGQTTRPITDRVKQSLFDIVTPLLPDAHVYDCFAGTGSLGLESLSRGAAHVVFFESDRSALALLQRNVASLRLEDRSRMISMDLFKWFATARAPEHRIDLVFLDPPYRFLQQRPAELQQLVRDMQARHLAPGGIIVFRHDSESRLEFEDMEPYDRRDYGGMAIELLRTA